MEQALSGGTRPVGAPRSLIQIQKVSKKEKEGSSYFVALAQNGGGKERGAHLGREASRHVPELGLRICGEPQKKDESHEADESCGEISVFGQPDVVSVGHREAHGRAQRGEHQSD